MLDNITAVEVTGDREVTVTMASPWSAFPAFLYASGRMGMMAQAQIDSVNECDELMIGTGPFKLESWAKNRQMVLSKNEDYWRTDENDNPLPYLDQITYIPLPNGPQRLNTIEADIGNNVAGHFSGPIQIDQIHDLADSGTVKNLESTEFAETVYMLLNSGAPPFDNKNARLAVAYAIDRDEYIALRANGLPTKANSPYAPGAIGHVEDPGFPEFDLAQAEEYVAAYEEETGQPLAVTISTTDNPDTVQDGDLLQQQLEAAGISVSRRTTDQANLINTAVAGDFQFFIWRNHPGGDPDEQYVWWHSGLPTNFGRINDPEIDRLLEAGRAEPDPEARSQIYDDLSTRFATEAYNIWAYYTPWSVPHSPTVNGVLGPQLPDGSDPFTGLALGHPSSGIWISE